MSAPADPVQADALVEVTEADIALRDAIVAVEWTGNHADYEGRIAEVIARHRLTSQPGTDAEVVATVRTTHQLELHPAFYDLPAGSGLYAHPPADKARIAELEAALERIANARSAMDGGSIAECRRIADQALRQRGSNQP